MKAGKSLRITDVKIGCQRGASSWAPLTALLWALWKYTGNWGGCPVVAYLEIGQDEKTEWNALTGMGFPFILSPSEAFVDQFGQGKNVIDKKILLSCEDLAGENIQFKSHWHITTW